MPLFAHQRASRRPTVTSGQPLDDSIKVEPERISTGARFQDILTDALYPFLEFGGVGDGRVRHDLETRRSWGENIDDDLIREALDAENLESAQNVLESSPAAALLAKDITRSQADFLPRSLRLSPSVKPRIGLLERVLGKATLPLLIGGSLASPLAKVLGREYGMRGQEGSTIIPGGDPRAHRLARRREEEREAEARLREAEARGYTR